ncbi:MAG: DUF285 domain-containing protein [Chitinophagaceae bacterium]|jgi:surface protein|nr:DUF285 domain-containing protein [Chitinophagaceae bacterium]
MKRFILIAVMFLCIAGIAHTQTYKPKTSGVFVTHWTTGSGEIDFPGASANYAISVYNITGGGGLFYQNKSASGTTIITGLPIGDTVAIETSGLTQFLYPNKTNAANGTLTKIAQWGVASWTTMNKAFYGAAQMTVAATDIPKLTSLTDMSYMFAGCNSLTAVPGMEKWDVSRVTNLSGMFFNASNFNSSLAGWNVSNVTNMSNMFYGALAFNQPIDAWGVKTNRVMDISYMFYGARTFNQPLAGWDVGSVKNMSNMFAGALAFDQPLNSWNVSNVTNMFAMFYGALAFNQPLNNWNTSKVNDMSSMFYGAAKFNRSLGNWNLNNIVATTTKGLISMLDNSGLNCGNYSSTLIGWAGNFSVPRGIALGAAGLNYTPSDSAIAARKALMQAGWVINDAGKGTCAVAPVMFLSFKVQAQMNNTALLLWTTATETNNKGFYIERSKDGANWIDLEFVNSQAPNGNSSLQYNYLYTDLTPPTGENFYRLKQIDFNEAATYSAAQKINLNKQDTTLNTPQKSVPREWHNY